MATEGKGKYGVFFQANELTEAQLASMSVDELDKVDKHMKKHNLSYLFPEVGKLLKLKKSALEVEKAETKLKTVKNQIAKTTLDISIINEQIKNAENINSIIELQLRGNESK